MNEVWRDLDAIRPTGKALHANPDPAVVADSSRSQERSLGRRYLHVVERCAYEQRTGIGAHEKARYGRIGNGNEG